MRRTFIAAALLSAALVFPLRAGAAKTVTVRVNDEFGVEKTHVLCAVQISKSLLPGKKLVACFVVANAKAGPAPKTYAVALATNGAALLARVGQGGQLSIVMKRGGHETPNEAPLSRKGKLYAVGVGEGVAVKNSAIRCGVTKQDFGGKKATTVGCFKIAPNGKPRPNSFGIGITDGGAFVVHFGADSKATPVKVVRHGH